MFSNFWSASRILRSWFASALRRPMRRQKNRVCLLVETLEDRITPAATPTNFEQYMLEVINRGRAAPATEAARLGISLNEGLAAGTISSAPKQPLAFNPSLIQSAQVYTAALLGAYAYFGHYYGPLAPQQRMSAAGYVFSAPGGW